MLSRFLFTLGNIVKKIEVLSTKDPGRITRYFVNRGIFKGVNKATKGLYWTKRRF